MVYPNYLLCLVLMIPAFLLTAVIITMMLIAAGPKAGWSVLIDFIAFFGAGIAEPMQYGWRIVALLAVIVAVAGAGAVPALRSHAFSGLAVVAALCVVFCLYAASTEDIHNVINALIVLSPSLAGIGACVWFAIKFKT